MVRTKPNTRKNVGCPVGTTFQVGNVGLGNTGSSGVNKYKTYPKPDPVISTTGKNSHIGKFEGVKSQLLTNTVTQQQYVVGQDTGSGAELQGGQIFSCTDSSERDNKKCTVLQHTAGPVQQTGSNGTSGDRKI